MKKGTIGLIVVCFLLTSSLVFAADAVRVSSKNFTEQFILGKIMYYLLEDAGIPVTDKINVGGTQVAREALEQGQIDVYMEYTGTAWLSLFKKKELVRDPMDLFRKIKDIDAQKELVWLAPAQFNNTYAIAMKVKTATEMGISTLSDWANWVKNNPGKMTVAVGAEFYSRVDGFKGMMEHYGLVFGKDLPDADVIKMEIALSKKAVRDGQALCGMAFATDGEIKAYDLIVLDDDKNYFPIYNPAPVIRKEVLDRYPQVKFLLDTIGPSLDTGTMTRLNYRVNINGEKPENVAKSWLTGVGLLIRKKK